MFWETCQWSTELAEEIALAKLPSVARGLQLPMKTMSLAPVRNIPTSCSKDDEDDSAQGRGPGDLPAIAMGWEVERKGGGQLVAWRARRINARPLSMHPNIAIGRRSTAHRQTSTVAIVYCMKGEDDFFRGRMVHRRTDGACPDSKRPHIDDGLVHPPSLRPDIAMGQKKKAWRMEHWQTTLARCRYVPISHWEVGRMGRRAARCMACMAHRQTTLARIRDVPASHWSAGGTREYFIQQDASIRPDITMGGCMTAQGTAHRRRALARLRNVPT